MDETTALGTDALLTADASERISIDGQALRELHRRGVRTKRFGTSLLALGAAFAVLAIGPFIYAQFNTPLTSFAEVDVPAAIGLNDLEVEQSSSGGANPYDTAAAEVFSMLDSPVFTLFPVVIGGLFLAMGVLRGDMSRVGMGVICLLMGLTLPHVIRTIAGETKGAERQIPGVVAMARDQRWNDVIEHTRNVSNSASSYVCSQAAYLADSPDDLRECLGRLKEKPNDVELDSRRIAVMARRAGMESFAAEHDAPSSDRHESAMRRFRFSASIAGCLFVLGLALTLFARQLLSRHQRLAAHSPAAAEQAS